MTTPDARPDHYQYDLPVRFFWDNGMATGRCVEVSEAGMLVTFKQAPDIWVVGSLTAEVRERNISIRARVIRVHDGEETGLSFRVTTDRERHELFLLLSAAMEEGKVVPQKD